MFTRIEWTEVIDLSSEDTTDKICNALVDRVRPLIDQILDSVQSGTFDYSAFKMGRDSKSGLTGLGGLYLFINKETKKIYLGGTVNITQRKADYNAGLKIPPAKNKELPLSIQSDIIRTGPASFYFVPILTFDRLNVTGISLSKDFTTKVNNFFDSRVEKNLLEHYLKGPLKDRFYNVKVIGKFQPGQQTQRSPQSGQPPGPVSYENYAWESISLAADNLRTDRKNIRVKVENGLMTRLTGEEFINFSGVKLTKETGNQYFQKHPNELQNIRSKIFPNLSKKKISNGEP
jgi:hypothetical protein